jgi:NADPH2:quinone reductase
MAEYVIAPEKNVFSIGEASFAAGAFVEPLSCVLHGIRKTPVSIGDRICVIGAGPIGILLMKVLQLQGASHICVAEKNPARLAFARENGADETFSDTGELPADHFDVVVDATGVPALFPLSLDIARPGAAVLSFGVPPAGRKIEIEPFLIFKKGLHIIGAFTSVRNSFQAVRLLTSGKITVEELISHRLSLTEFEKGIELIESGTSDVMKVMIEPNR